MWDPNTHTYKQKPIRKKKRKQQVHRYKEQIGGCWKEGRAEMNKRGQKIKQKSYE